MTQIIAEICQNHNGDTKILQEMVHAASEAGADYAKIQAINSSELTFRERFENGLMEGKTVKVIKRPYQAELNRLKKLDLTENDHGLFLEYCKKFNIKPMCTAFSYSNVDLLEKLKFKSIKIASFDCASHNLIREACKKNFEEIIVSTGASYNQEIKETSEILKKSGKMYGLLHCVSIYPTPIENAHLSRMNYLRKFSDIVGYSDHSNPEVNANVIPATAIYLGAQLIERHFTILKKNETKDGVVSVNSGQLKDLTSLKKMSRSDLKSYIDEKIPDYRTLLGMENRDMSLVELLNRDYYQGRFASKKKDNSYLFNWEKR